MMIFITMRQRLVSAEALIGYWGDAGRALEVHVALRLWNIGMAGWSSIPPAAPSGGHGPAGRAALPE